MNLKVLLILPLALPFLAKSQPTIDTYDNGQIKYKGTLVEGKKEGKWEFWDSAATNGIR